tara:strand:+ start:625 stop:1374 length:750 start_codon:yes stop_codon:yes gene_type:complete
MAVVTFGEVCDQIASMLGADEMDDLPVVDQNRVKIVVNQGYRECYAPLDGRRPRWASRKGSLTLEEGVQSYDLETDIVDIEKYPELEGKGPLSPMNARTDESVMRSHHGGDFRPFGNYRGRFPSINMDEAEIDRPIWYFVDQVDEGSDADVVPRLVFYPIPDKEYVVNYVANFVPDYISDDDSNFRLPADIVWDILYPISQGKLLTDPRYNGDNKELILRSSAEAKKRLNTFASVQKHKNLRLTKRSGW